MKKIFAANWISAARAVAPAQNTNASMFHPTRRGIDVSAPRFAMASSARD